MKKVQLKIQNRNLDIDSGNIDEDNRTVELSFSSEEPVDRYFGTEILDHNPDSVDLSRLNNGAAVLEDHEGGQIGVVEGAKIEKGIGMAKLKFSKVGKGAEVFTDIVDGIRKNISFGYQINDLTREKEDLNDNPTYRSFDWTPYEISVVGTPADTTIGIGRNKDLENEIEVEDNFRELESKVTQIKIELDTEEALEKLDELIEKKEEIEDKEEKTYSRLKYYERKLQLMNINNNNEVR